MTPSNLVHLDRDKAAGLPLESAAKAAARRGADFFPSRVGLNAAARSPSYLKSLLRSVRDGYTPAQAEVVLAPKFGGGTRPAADLRVSDRILFDALIGLLDRLLPEDLINRSVTADARIQAEERLRGGPHTHVVVTDVVAFYEYIERDRLVTELLDLTGDDEVVAALAALLDGVTSRPRGIPQASPEATLLGDVYLSIADRELARAGFEIVRWADDYRIAASEFREAHRAITLLERALREIGLVISGDKTWTPSTAKFGEWVEAQQATRAMIQDVLARIRQRQAQDYAADQDEPRPTVRPRPRVDRALERQFVADLGDDAPWGSSPDGYAASRRVQLSLRELGRTGSSAPLERLADVLLRYPHLTRDAAGYLRRRIASGRTGDTVNAIAAVLADESYPFVWQAGWLVHALITVPSRLPKSVVSTCTDWLRRTQLPGFIRGRAAILLATEGALSLDALNAVWHEMPEANREDLVAAATLLDDEGASRFLRAVRRDPLYAAIADQSPNSSVAEL